MTRSLVGALTVLTFLVAADGRASAARSCMYEGKTYYSGAVVCQVGQKYECDDGTWKRLGSACENNAADQREGEREPERYRTE